MKSLVITILILFCSCSTSKRCQHHLDKAKQFGCLVTHNDTVIRIVEIKGDTIHETIKVGMDSMALDSFLNTIKDTCISKEIIKTLPSFIPCKAKPYHFEDSLYMLDIKLLNGQFDVNIIIKDRKAEIQTISHNTETIKEVETKPWWLIPLIVVFIAMILGLIFSRFK